MFQFKFSIITVVKNDEINLEKTIKSIINSYITPTINYKTEDPECDLDYTTKSETKKNINHAISNNFGFGGHNAVLCFKRFNASV